MPRPERPLDPESGPVARFATGLRELRQSVGGPGYRELARQAHYAATTLAQAARGDALPSLTVTLAFVRACGGDVDEWERRWRETAATAVPPAAANGAARSPYVGLTVYGPGDAEWFRGRDRAVAAVVEQVACHRFVAVVGASGAGKSSVLRAGLVPALAADGWSTLVVTPGAHPLEECAVRLGARLAIVPGELARDLTDAPRNLGLAVRQVMADQHDDTELLLVVDQFEEVFALCQDPLERESFIAALLAAAGDEDSRTRVVLGVRADFYAHCARHAGLVEALQNAQVLVGPMSAAELTEAITEPAVRAGLSVEKTLVATVVHDAAGRPGALPFVSHALWETWRQRTGNELSLARYQAVGGVAGAIAHTAERVYQGLDERQRRTARRIFLRLTAVGEDTEDTRRRVARTELGADPDTAEVLHRLAAARLVTLAEETAEIAHEALISGWPALRGWLVADRAALRTHRRLTEAAAEWDRHGRDEGYLYRGKALGEWQDPDEDVLNEVERAFLTAGVARQDRERTARQRRLRWSLVAAGVVVVVVSILATFAMVQAAQAADERDLALSRQLAANARDQLQVDPELALLLATEAMKVKPTAEAEAALRQAVVDSRVRAVLPTYHGQVAGVAFSADGRRIATTGDDGMARIWERRGPSGSWQLQTTAAGNNGALSGPEFSPDGRYLVAGAFVSTLRVWDLGKPGDRAAWLPSPSPGAVKEPTFSPDAHRVAGVMDGGVRLWDLVTGAASPSLRDTGLFFALDGATDAAFSPDGHYLAGTSSSGAVRVWDLTGQRQPVTVQGSAGALPRLTFSPDGQRLASTGEDGRVRIWDPVDGRALYVLGGHEGAVLSLEFSPDGRMLATSGEDGTIRIVNSGDDTNPIVLRGHRGTVWDIAFSPDGRSLASVGTDDDLRVWDATRPGDPVMLRGHGGPARSAVFTPDGTRVVSGGADGTVRIWRTDGANLAVLHDHHAPVRDVAVSADGRRFASIDDSRVIWAGDLATGKTNPEQRPDLPSGGVELSQDGRHLVTGNTFGSISVWDDAGGSVSLRQPNIEDGPNPGDVGQVAMTNDGTRIASAERDGSVRIWRTGDFRGHSRDDYGDPTVLSGHQGPVTTVAFSPDGKVLVSGGEDGTVRIWPGGREPIVLHDHRGVITGIAFSPDGRWFATSARDGTLRIRYTTGDREPVVYRGFQSSIESVAVGRDGRHLLTTHDDGTVRIQRCEVCGTTEQVVALAKDRATRQLTAEERTTFGLT